MVFCEPFQGQGWHRFRFLLSVRQSITNEPMVDLCWWQFREVKTKCLEKDRRLMNSDEEIFHLGSSWKRRVEPLHKSLSLCSMLVVTYCNRLLNNDQFWYFVRTLIELLAFVALNFLHRFFLGFEWRIMIFDSVHSFWFSIIGLVTRGRV